MAATEMRKAGTKKSNNKKREKKKTEGLRKLNERQLMSKVK